MVSECCSGGGMGPGGRLGQNRELREGGSLSPMDADIAEPIGGRQARV
jgi:hypothetical protein